MFARSQMIVSTEVTRKLKQCTCPSVRLSTTENVFRHLSSIRPYYRDRYPDNNANPHSWDLLLTLFPIGVGGIIPISQQVGFDDANIGNFSYVLPVEDRIWS